MRHMVRCGVIFVLAGSAAIAVAGPQYPVSVVGHKSPLAGERKARYLLRQLDLTEVQAAKAEELLESTFSKDNGRAGDNAGQVRTIWAKLEQAKRKKDQKTVDALTEQLRRLTEASPHETEFFQEFGPVLTEEQMQLLARARGRLERHPSGGLRPGDLLAIVRTFDLTDEQNQKLYEAFKAVRKKLGPLLRLDGEKKAELVNFFADEIRTFLTTEQLATFEYRVRVLRPDLIGEGLRVSKTATSTTKDDKQAKSEKK